MASKTEGEVKLTITFTEKEMNLLARQYLRDLHMGDTMDIQEYLLNDESEFLKDKFEQAKTDLEPLIAYKVDVLLAG